MKRNCENCRSTNVTYVENMEICDDCLSTVVFCDGSFSSKHFTDDDFRRLYSSIKSDLDLDNPDLMKAGRELTGMNPEIPTLLNFYAVCCMQQSDDYNKVIYMLQKAVRINPRYGTAHYNLASAYRLANTMSPEKSKNTKEAVKHLNEAYKYITPKHVKYNEFIRNCVLSLSDMGRNVMAIATLEDAMKQGFQITPELLVVLERSKTEVGMNGS